MSRLADALTAMFRIDISVPMDAAGASEVEIARRNFESAQLMGLCLVAAFADSEATSRGGVVFGELAARGGDYYGRLVNMASRIADLAVPGEILTDVETANAAVRQLFDHAGKRTLEGFADPVEPRSLA